MDRRDFIRNSMAAAGVAAAAACTGSVVKKAGRKPETGEMTYRQTPDGTGKISLLGYGCMRWPLGQDEDTDSHNDPIDQEQVNRLVARAMEAGVNYFDTSPTYCRGGSEEATGTALSAFDRSSYFLATKLSNFKPEAQSREASVRMYENSFARLRTDYIDYYLLHSVGRSMEDLQRRYIDNGMLDFLIGEREKGRIRHLGFSYHGGKEVFDHLMEMDQEVHWDFVQIQMNYVDWEYGKLGRGGVDASYFFEALKKRRIPVIIMEPLLGGRLADVPARPARMMQERRPFDSIASWAFRFCGSFPEVLTILSGMTYMEHLEDNLKTFSPLQPFSQEEFEFIGKVAGQLAQYPTVPCTGCAYCMPCPYGIDIPGVFRHYNKCVNEGDVEPDVQDPDYRRLRRRYLSSYAKAVEDARQADKCIGCGSCLELCPQKIDIPKQMRRLDRFVENLKQEK